MITRVTRLLRACASRALSLSLCSRLQSAGPLLRCRRARADMDGSAQPRLPPDRRYIPQCNCSEGAAVSSIAPLRHGSGMGLLGRKPTMLGLPSACAAMPEGLGRHVYQCSGHGLQCATQATLLAWTIVASCNPSVRAELLWSTNYSREGWFIICSCISL